MRDYFIRRLLLIPPTLVGITMMVLLITRFAPGGPLDTMLLEARMGGQGQGAARAARDQQGGLSPEQLLRLEEYYGHDKPFLVAYAAWLGLAPRDTNRSRAEFEGDALTTQVRLSGTAEEITVTRDERGRAVIEPSATVDTSGWRVRIETPEEQRRRWDKRNPDQPMEEDPPHRALVFQPQFSGVLQGDLGRSTRYNEPVWVMMERRFPISTFFGIMTLLITYSVCIPLGILKAIRHRTWIDNATSVLVFTGYAIPGFVLGTFLLVFFAARLGWFPIEGFVSPDFADRSFGGKLLDLAHHAVLPLACYVVGSFALLTMLVKNNLMDNLAADYVRTAIAKGASFRRAVFQHALRNSIIPVATTFGQSITLFVSGNLLIERIFDIDGFGLLSFNALLERDYPVVMGVFLISGFLMLLGNVLSDLLVASLDPRIRFK